MTKVNGRIGAEVRILWMKGRLGEAVFDEAPGSQGAIGKRDDLRRADQLAGEGSRLISGDGVLPTGPRFELHPGTRSRAIPNFTRTSQSRGLGAIALRWSANRSANG